MSNIKIDIVDNGITTLATAGKWCDRNIDIEVNVPSSGGGGDIPEETLILTGNCGYMFYAGKWDWFINEYGNRVITSNLDSIGNMFNMCKVDKIPFSLNGKSVGNVDMINCFCGSNIKTIPTINMNTVGGINSLFSSANYLREIPDECWNVNSYYGHTNTSTNHTNIFSGCYSLRYITPKLLSNIWNNATGAYYSCYYGGFYNCFALDEIINLPVAPGKYTSNAFNTCFSNCHRLKEMTFETNEDGTPKIVEWTKQTIDLSASVGSGSSSSKTDFTKWNSGITADKEVIDDATYAALKDDPDWFTCSYNYNRYNHDSAVRTINSLPDTSSVGGNTIKFKGSAGSLTDGGAINTLTEAEIAVAAAKGWTVSLV